MAMPEECPQAIAWFDDAMDWVQEKHIHRKHEEVHQFKNGWRKPPCIRKLETATLPQGTRHTGYFEMSRFYAWINMHPLEAEDHIRRIDDRNPIRDPDYISRVVHSARKYKGFSACGKQVFMQYCDQKRCFVERFRKSGSSKKEKTDV